METKERIKETVRETYGNVASQGKFVKLPSAGSPCCGSGINGNDSDSVCGSGSKEFNPEFVSSQLGYSKQDIGYAPEGANLGLGCGNPKTIAGIKKGETVVDLGSGGGFDCFLAAKEVGPTGLVIGVDMTPEMITRARENLAKVKTDNVQFRLGEIEHLPVENNAADLIISNCVINLSPSKQQVFKEAFRVLKKGGRIAVSDILALKPLPEDIQKDLNAISACIGGAAEVDEIKMMMKNAGFEQVKITLAKVSKEITDELFSNNSISEFVSPAYIEAVKPNKE